MTFRPLPAARVAACALAVSLLPRPVTGQAARSTPAPSARAAASRAAASVPSPRSYLKFEVGADRTLADWGQITGYFAKLAAAATAVKLDTLGPSTSGRPFVVATISSPANIRRIGVIRANQAKLADPRKLSAAEERRLVSTQPAVIVISCNIHASEIASSQMSMELAYRLATNDTLQRYLENVVVLPIPSMNPDGEQMVTAWYRKNLGTKWEGGPLPWLYHPYVGHDNNRDWYMVTQKETRLVTDLLYRQWFPEVFYDVHQQGSDGMRITVPPHVDPIDPNVDALIVRGINQVGAQMSWELESRGKSGVGDGATYDLWWHGGARSTPTRHNMIGLLTEAASVKVATPITLDSADLKGHSRGLPRYERRVNFPNPWPGGTWRLRDIVDYELIAAEALVKLASDQRGEYVRNFVQLGRKQVELGRTQAPYAYEIPRAQPDPSAVARLVEVLRVGGVEVDSTTKAYVVRMDQPYRAHAKDLLEVQNFPKMEKWPGGPVERPYDVAGWTLPLQLGVKVVAINEPLGNPRPLQQVRLSDSLKAGIVRVTVPCVGTVSDHAPYEVGDMRNTACYREVFRALKSGQVPVTMAGRPAAIPHLPRVALYKPWTANMDEGWTRWVFEQFALPFTNVTDSIVKAANLRASYDVVVIPDMSFRDAKSGMPDSLVPPQYAGGLGDAGFAALKAFVDSGGTLVTFDRASEVATTALRLPVKRITVPPRQDDWEYEEPAATDSARRAAVPLYAPGSILRVLVDKTHPVAYGMPDTAAVYFTNSNSFDVPARGPARVIARYPARADDILLSGYLQGGQAIAGKAAAVEVPAGKGRVVMFGFRPQYRGQSYGTFKMVFNALLMGAE
jgi:hypothetical protein